MTRAQHTAKKPMVGPESGAPALHGRWLFLVRAGWATLVILNLGLFAAAIPALYAQRGAPPGDVLVGLVRLGVPEGFYAAYVTVLLAAFGLGCFVVAAVIAWHRSADPVALFVSLFLVLLGSANHPNVQALAAAYPALLPLLELSWGLLTVAMILFVLVFPDGRFVPHWMRVPAGLFVVGTFAALFSGGGSLAEPPDALGLILITALLAGTASQIYRYCRVSNPAQRQQIKWVVFGITVASAAQIGAMLAAPLFTRPGLPALLYSAASVTIVTLASLLIPASIGLAILRHRIYDIDLVINRALVYSGLTAIVAGLYVLVVGGLGILLQARGELLLSLVGAGLVAVLFAPLKERLQSAVNHLMYGERDDPYAALSRLGERLEATLSPDALLSTAVETVAEALKLPHAAVEIQREDGTLQTAAEVGGAMESPVRLQLSYGGETVGRLVLGRRSGETDFSAADRRLLEDLARQVGVAVHAARLSEQAIRLSEDLQSSRGRLVTAREEERRRLRRDLHDGLGPQLASLAMKTEAARELLISNPHHADALLGAVTDRAQESVADIRRLVYGLRPPALDDLGLVGALRSQAAHGECNGLQVNVELLVDMPSLPAAVEVAAYRIAQEALSNVRRHAEARSCTIRLAYEEASGALGLEISDDGRGIPEDRRAGVGLSSMRERAEELGGSFRVDTPPEGGTRVCASLPITGEAKEHALAAAEQEE